MYKNDGTSRSQRFDCTYYTTRVFELLQIIFICLPLEEYPSCRQTTIASEWPQKSSHTVPHVLLLHNSTLPWVDDEPLPASLMSPVVQPEWSNRVASISMNTVILSRHRSNQYSLGNLRWTCEYVCAQVHCVFGTTNKHCMHAMLAWLYHNNNFFQKGGSMHKKVTHIVM